MDAEIRLPIEHRKLPQDWKTYTVMITGLKGGHSGEDIHRGHGNANSLLGRFMAEAGKRFTYGISAVKEEPTVWQSQGEARADLSLAPQTTVNWYSSQRNCRPYSGKNCSRRHHC